MGGSPEQPVGGRGGTLVVWDVRGRGWGGGVVGGGESVAGDRLPDRSA